LADNAALLDVMVILDTGRRHSIRRRSGLVVFFHVRQNSKNLDRPMLSGISLDSIRSSDTPMSDLVVRQARYDRSAGRFVIPSQERPLFFVVRR